MNTNLFSHWFDLTLNQTPSLFTWPADIVFYWSAARRNSLELHFYNDHDRKVDGSTPTHASLLCPWIRCCTITAWWNLTSSKLKTFLQKTRKQRQLLSESGFVLCIAPLSLSRDRRIKMKKSISSSKTEQFQIKNFYMGT